MVNTLSRFLKGTTSAILPNYAKAKAAFSSFFELIEREPVINNFVFEESKNKSDYFEDGDIEFQNVQFCYPQRPNQNILNDFNLHIKRGQTVAFVGPSGCGKSTITQLLQRFYDPTSGLVQINNKNLKDMNINTLRSHIGIVSQEPILFDASIKENIAYGDNSRTVTIDEIYEAARKANIHDFIVSLPQVNMFLLINPKPKLFLILLSVLTSFTGLRYKCWFKRSTAIGWTKTK